MHLKGLGSAFSFREPDDFVFFRCRLCEELLRRLVEVAELADAVEYADELLHSLPTLAILAEESDRRSGRCSADEFTSKAPAGSTPCVSSGIHSGSFTLAGRADFLNEGLEREYRLLRRGRRERYVLVLSCGMTDPRPGDDAY